MVAFFRCIFFLLLVSGPLRADDAPYLLGPHDQVEVRVFKEPDLSTIARIQADNSIIMPVIGKVKIGGLSEQDAIRRIQKALIDGGVVQDPAITLRITQYSSKQVAVLGYVMAPGSYFLDRAYTLSDILARAGGAQVEGADFLYFTDYTPETGQTSRHRINIQAILGGDAEAIDPPVGDGDKIFIPRAPVFYIYGQVRQPGSYRLYPGMTVEQALATAGGTTELGKSSKIRKRDTETGKMIPIQLDATLIASDVIYIPERLF